MKLRVRTLMVVVCAVGLIVGLYVLNSRRLEEISARYSRRAQDEAVSAANCRREISDLDNEDQRATTRAHLMQVRLERDGPRGSEDNPFSMALQQMESDRSKRRAQKERLVRLVSYHEKLHKTYVNAAARPTMPVTPDPPPPK